MGTINLLLSRPWLFCISQKPNIIIVLLYIERKKKVWRVSGTDNLFLNVKKYLRFSQFFLFHVISKQLLCHLRRPVLVFNYFFDVLLGQRSKPGSHVFASSLTASNTKRANLTWLPLEIMHRGHTWHDYPWPWVSMTWLLYNLQLDDVPGADFENSLYAFGQSEKR